MGHAAPPRPIPPPRSSFVPGWDFILCPIPPPLPGNQDGIESGNLAGTRHLDTKGDGGMVVAPPSMHASGNAYTWIDERRPAQAPAWLLERLFASKRKTRPGSVHPVPSPRPTGSPTPALDLLSGVREHTRNEALFRAACSDRGRGAGADAIRDGCLAAAKRCLPPYPPQAARKVAESVVRRYPPGSGRLPGELLLDSVALLTANARAVFCATWDRREYQDCRKTLEGGASLLLLRGQTWMTYDSVAKATGLSRASVRRAIDAMEAVGLATRSPASGRGLVLTFGIFEPATEHSQNRRRSSSGEDPAESGPSQAEHSRTDSEHSQSRAFSCNTKSLPTEHPARLSTTPVPPPAHAGGARRPAEAGGSEEAP